MFFLSRKGATTQFTTMAFATLCLCENILKYQVEYKYFYGLTKYTFSFI